MPAKQWPAARNAWSRVAGRATNELVPELVSGEILPDIVDSVVLTPGRGGCGRARWRRGRMSAPARHRDHLIALPPACRARQLTRKLTRIDLQAGSRSIESSRRLHVLLSQATTGEACGQIRTSGFRRLAGCEAVLEARARAYSSSHSFCMVFSVNLSLRPILSLISLSLLAAVLVLDLW